MSRGIKWGRIAHPPLALLLAVFVASLGGTAAAQQPAGGPKGVNAFDGLGFGPGNPGGNQGADANPDGAQGGADQADFDSLIDLITSTVEADSWQENGTGEGEIMPFPTGVYVDAAGSLRIGDGQLDQRSLASIRDGGLRRQAAEVGRPSSESGIASTAERDASDSQAVSAAPKADGGKRDARRSSALRYVSLPRLEVAIAARQARHMPLDPSMLTLAGLERVALVLAYPETGDLVLAGPAGDWQATPDGGLASAATGRPLVRLDDLLALWRRQDAQRGRAFGCSIVPRREALARTQEFLAASAARPLDPGGRGKWLSELRATLGAQDVEFFGVDPDTRIGGVLLAADYHMKLIGMGLAPGVPGVKSYLATVRLGPDGQVPPMTVLRWWFSMPASSVGATAEHDAFALPAQCVEVLSENELLAARGERIHTGEADELTRGFAASFTQEFFALSDKYPIYSQLERIFELSLALAVIQKEGLAENVGWTPTLLADADRLRLPRASVPRTVETVMNHRVIGGRQIVAGISGGVLVDGGKALTVAAAKAADVDRLTAARKKPQAAVEAGPAASGEIRWWWD